MLFRKGNLGLIAGIILVCEQLKISGDQQRWPQLLQGIILRPPTLLVVADY